MHTIVLHNQNRRFTCLSTHPQADIGGSAYNRVIFLLHGFPDNNESYSQVLPILQAHFKRTLIVAPLMRGYEPSSQGPGNEYCMYELAQDVKAWIETVNPENSHRVHLVGHDWGAIVAYKTASKYPELVTSMVTLAIPYMTNLRLWQLVWYAPWQIWCSSYMLRMQSALFYGPAFSEIDKPGYLDQLWQYWSPGWKFGEEIGSVRKTLGQPGVVSAATAYYRNLIPWKRLEETKWSVNFSQVPTLILGGTQDGCMQSALFELESRLLAQTPKVRVQLVKGVGHFLHREDPQSVGSLITDWLDKYP